MLRYHYLTVIASLLVGSLGGVRAHEEVNNEGRILVSEKNGQGLIAYTLRAWKTDEFDFTEIGRIYHEYVPAMFAGKLSAVKMEEKVDRSLAQLRESGKIAVADGKPGESLCQKLQRLRMAIFESGKVKLRIFTCELDGTCRRQLTFEGDNGRPDWSPDGKRITYAVQRGRERWVGVMDADGTGSRQLTASPKRNNTDDPTWSPDGTKILFTTGRRGLPELWLMNADGSDQVPLFPLDPYPFPGRASWQPVALTTGDQQSVPNNASGGQAKEDVD